MIQTNLFFHGVGVTITLKDITHLRSLSVLGCSISTLCVDECVHVYKCLRNEISKLNLLVVDL